MRKKQIVEEDMCTLFLSLRDILYLRVNKLYELQLV